MPERRFEWLRPDSYRQLKRAAPIAYLPWGAHEWHGAHNVLGVDSLKAHRICLALAEAAGGIVFPAVYCGYGTMQRYSQDCTLEFPVELIEQMARHYFNQFMVEGFRVVVAVLGHYGPDHVKAIQRIARWANEDFAPMRVIAKPDPAWTTPELPGDHGAANETSYMMHFAPGRVDLSQLPTIEQEPTMDWRAYGIGGLDPRTNASADRGKRQMDLLIERAVPEILAALDEASPKKR